MAAVQRAAAAAPARVTLAVTDDGSPPTPALLAVLAGEAIEAETRALAATLSGEPDDCEVLLVWSPHGLEPVACQQVVAWARRRVPPTGLLGWCEHADRLAAERMLAAGFDDAQGGTSSARELAVRLRALRRRVLREAARAGEPTPARLRHGDLVVDARANELWLDGRAVSLTPSELTALVALLRARGAVLGRAELREKAWGAARGEAGERAVDNVILRLRRKLGRPELIETVRGVGFRIAAAGEVGGGGG